MKQFAPPAFFFKRLLVKKPKKLFLKNEIQFLNYFRFTVTYPYPIIVTQFAAVHLLKKTPNLAVF